MNLTPIAHLEGKYIRKMKRLNKRSFPKKERIKFEDMLDLTNSKHFDFLAIKDEENFIGFLLLAKDKENVYLFFFAISEKYQSEGYGSLTLTSLREYYPYQQIIIDLEEVKGNEVYIQARELKKEFYEACGFHETGFEVQYANKHFELLSNAETFNQESFLSLLKEITPAINTIKKETFEPELIEKKPL